MYRAYRFESIIGCLKLLAQTYTPECTMSILEELLEEGEKFRKSDDDNINAASSILDCGRREVDK